MRLEAELSFRDKTSTNTLLYCGWEEALNCWFSGGGKRHEDEGAATDWDTRMMNEGIPFCRIFFGADNTPTDATMTGLLDPCIDTDGRYVSEAIQYSDSSQDCYLDSTNGCYVWTAPVIAHVGQDTTVGEWCITNDKRDLHDEDWKPLNRGVFQLPIVLPDGYSELTLTVRCYY